MADTGAKTQSSDKTNPLSVSEMTLLYLNAESSPASHSRSTKPKGRGNWSQRERVASEAEKGFSKKKKKEAFKNSRILDKKRAYFLFRKHLT